MTQAGISVLIPTRDMNHHIPGLLHNIAAQIRPDLGDEVLIYFDGSPIDEKTGTLFAKYPYVTAFAAEVNRGVSTARNFLINKAKNQILRFQDCDDQLAPYSMELARETIKRLDEWHILVGGQFMYRDHRFLRLIHEGLENMVAPLQRHNTFVVNMCYANKASVVSVGGFDPKLAFEEDWDLWLRLIQKYGKKAFAISKHIFGIYNSYTREMNDKATKRPMSVDGLPVREYIRKKHNLPAPAKKPRTP